MIYSRKCMECRCGKQIYLLKDTLFHKSHIPLPKWFFAIQLMIDSKRGVSAMQIKRMLEITYKSAWGMCHKIRAAMKKNDTGEVFNGVVQVDEVYIGGKKQRNTRIKFENKIPIVGAIEHIDGKPCRVRCRVLENADKENLYNFISKNIAKFSELHTDGAYVYHDIYKEGYRHKIVNHSHEYITPEGISTQSIDGFWSQLRGTIRGAHITVSKKHLSKYIGELEFKYNNRNNQQSLFDLIL